MNDLGELLRVLVKQAVHDAMVENATAAAKLPDEQLAFTTPQAARLLGIAPHVLSDARRRGLLSGRRCGKKILYSRAELIWFLASTDDQLSATADHERRPAGARRDDTERHARTAKSYKNS